MEEPQRNHPQPIGYSQLISGAGIGLLVGTLIGLSLSPVVGTVLGGLTALLAAFLGLSDQQLTGNATSQADNSESTRRIREYRAGSFGIACTLGVLMGLFIRTHNLLGVSIEDQYRSWTEIGFSQPEARQLIVYKELGIVPEGRTESNRSDGERADLSVLYTTRLETCRNLAPDEYQNINETLNAWNLQREGNWSDMAAQIKNNVPTEYREPIVESAWRLACDIEQ